MPTDDKGDLVPAILWRPLHDQQRTLVLRVTECLFVTSSALNLQRLGLEAQSRRRALTLGGESYREYQRTSGIVRSA